MKIHIASIPQKNSSVLNDNNLVTVRVCAKVMHYFCANSEVHSHEIHIITEFQRNSKESGRQTDERHCGCQ